MPEGSSIQGSEGQGKELYFPTTGSQGKVLGREATEPDEYLTITASVIVVKNGLIEGQGCRQQDQMIGKEAPECIQAGMEVAWAPGSAAEIKRGGWVGAMFQSYKRIWHVQSWVARIYRKTSENHMGWKAVNSLGFQITSDISRTLCHFQFAFLPMLSFPVTQRVKTRGKKLRAGQKKAGQGSGTQAKLQ